MQQLPQEVIDLIVAHSVTGQECEALGLRCTRSLRYELRGMLWHRLLNAEINHNALLDDDDDDDDEESSTATGHMTSSSTAAILKPSYDDIEPLRKLRLVGQPWNRGVLSFFQRLSVLIIDFDRMESMTAAVELCSAQSSRLDEASSSSKHWRVERSVPRHLLIQAGDSHTRPFRRVHLYNNVPQGQATANHEVTLLSNYTDFADLYEIDPPEAWQPKHSWSSRKISSFEQAVPPTSSGEGKIHHLRNLLQSCHGEIDGKANPLFKTLTVKFPSASSEWDSGIEHSAECWDLEAVDSLLQVLRDELFQRPVHPGYHQSIICEHVVDLRLELPTTRSFGYLFGQAATKLSVPQVSSHPNPFPTLRSLLVAITDATGPCGDAKYTSFEYNYSDMEADALDGALTDPYVSGYVPSNLQLRGEQNRDHQRDLWRFVASCQTVEDLCVEATQALKLDLLWEIVDDQDYQIAGERRAEKGSTHRQRDWTKTGLRNLGLCRIDTSGSALLRMFQPRLSRYDDTLQQSPIPPSPLRRLNLARIRIVPADAHDTDSWATVFRALRRECCPELEFLGIEYLSYHSTHAAFTHAARLSEDTATVWTTSEDDLRALGEVFGEKPDLVVEGLGRRWRLAREIYTPGDEWDELCDF